MVASVGSSVRGFLLFGILDEGVRPGNIVRAATRLGTKCQRGSRSPGAGSGYGDGLAVGEGWLDNVVSAETPWEMLEKKRSNKCQVFSAQAPSEAKARPHK
jgi:hypothetical protein